MLRPLTQQLGEGYDRMSNEAKRRIGRRLDYVHRPVVRRPDDAFFVPWAASTSATPKSFLGIIHHADGIDDFRRRRDLARSTFRPSGSRGRAVACSTYSTSEPPSLELYPRPRFRVIEG